MLRQGVRQRRTAVNGLRNLVDHVFEFRVFTLVFQNVQALQHRKTRRAHRREHTGKTSNFGGLDTRTNLDLDFRRFLLKANDDEATAHQQRFGFSLVLRLERALEIVTLAIGRLV